MATADAVAYDQIYDHLRKLDNPGGSRWTVGLMGEYGVELVRVYIEQSISISWDVLTLVIRPS